MQSQLSLRTDFIFYGDLKEEAAGEEPSHCVKGASSTCTSLSQPHLGKALLADQARTLPLAANHIHSLFSSFAVCWSLLNF